MSIAVGHTLPNCTLSHMGESGPNKITTDEIFSGKKVVLFAVPGAFTPTCSNSHLPGYVVNADAIFAKGVDSIVCLSVNDAFVMGAWGEQNNAENILMLADGSAEFSQAMGLELDLTKHGMGIRADRFAMIVDDGKVELLNREAPGKFEVSNAETVLAAL